MITVNNCTDCPMAQNTVYKYTNLYSCNICDATMTVFKDSDLEDSELPLPTLCPLRGGKIIIDINQLKG